MKIMKKLEKLILCIVGMPGSGKSTVAEIIRKDFPACSFETGDIIREEIRKRGWRYTKENDAKISKWFHSGREHLIVGGMAKRIKACKRKIIAAGGFISPKEIKMLEKIGKIILIVVTVPSTIRYKRQLLRRRFSSQTEKYLRERDKRELGEGLGKLIKMADYRIINNSGKHELEKKTVVLVEKIIKKDEKQAYKHQT